MPYIAGIMPELSKVVHVMRRLVTERWGGTEGVVFNVSRELLARGVESTIHCTAMLAPPGREKLGPVTVVRHRYVFPWLGLSESAKEALRLKGGSPLSWSLFMGVLRENNVSLIHVHVQHRLGGIARTVARLKRVPYVVSLHGGYFTLPEDQMEKMKAPFAGKVEWGKIFGALLGSRRVLQDADGILCVGQSEYEEVRKRYPNKRVFQMPNGVDVQRFAQADGSAFRTAFGYDTDDKLVLCVSRIDSQKNQVGLVRAFSRFAQMHPAHKLVLIGPVSVDAYREEVVAEIAHLKLSDNIRLIDGLRPDDPLLPSAYKASEMFVLPSVHEPFGIVVLEAWAAGIPVIASRVGGIPGIAVDRKTALLAEPGSEDDLVEKMEELAADGELRAELVGHAFRTVESKFGWPAIAEQLCSIYNELLNAHKRLTFDR